MPSENQGLVGESLTGDHDLGASIYVLCLLRERLDRIRSLLAFVILTLDHAKGRPAAEKPTEDNVELPLISDSIDNLLVVGDDAIRVHLPLDACDELFKTQPIRLFRF